MVLLALHLPAAAAGGAGRPLDVAGTLTFLVGTTAVLFAVLDPGSAGAPGGSAGRLLAGLVGVAGLAAFVRIERTSADPLLALDLFRERPFRVGCAASFFSGAAMFGALIHVPLLIQWGRGTDATTAGISLMTMSSGWSVGGFAAGLLLNRLGFWWLGVLGMAGMTAGYAALAAHAGGSWSFLLVVGAAIGLGMGLSTVPLVVAVQTLIRPERRGIATAAVLFFRSIGGTLGVAAMGAVLTGRLGVRARALEAGGAVALPPALAAALVDAMGPVFWLGVAAAVLGLLATGFLPGRSPAEPTARPALGPAAGGA
jgi:Na+/melibiose symporter-like transporter